MAYIDYAPVYYDKETARELAYKDYQQKVAMTRDITNSIADNTNRSIAANAAFTKSINTRIVDAQIATTNAMFNNTQAMLGELYSGFSGVSNQLQSGFSHISRQIGVMNANMSMAFAALNTTVQKSAQAIYDRLDAMNDILSNPSLTKSRELFRRAAVSYNKGFYEEAKNDLLIIQSV